LKLFINRSVPENIIMRDNVEAEGPEEYFRKSITVSFLYCTLNEMKTRFTDLHARTALGLQFLVTLGLFADV
jgi:hypothetical protein